MGYYSTLSFLIDDKTICDPEKVNKLEKYFSNYNNQDVYGFYGVHLNLDKDNHLTNIVLDDYFGKFYDDHLFNTHLSKCLIDGSVRLVYKGEDGEQWGYLISPNHVEELYVVCMTESQYNQYKDFLKETKVR